MIKIMFEILDVFQEGISLLIFGTNQSASQYMEAPAGLESPARSDVLSLSKRLPYTELGLQPLTRRGNSLISIRSPFFYDAYREIIWRS